MTDLRRAAPLLAVLLAGATPALADEVTSGECADCHADGDDEIPQITEAMLSGSSHDGMECLDCHGGIEELPHDEVLPTVDCGLCHDEESEVYVLHGRAEVGVDPDIPACWDCHGSHVVLPSSDPASPVSSRNLPATCNRCHGDVDLAKKHDIKLKRPVEVYQESVHGRATLRGGIDLAATCNDCHSTNGSAHQILGPGNSQSTINHFNIPHTCGQCHETIEREYSEGIHGQLAARGETDTPVCTTCHGEHGILPTHDPRARVSPTQVAEATCAPCHESAFLNEKYGLPAGRLASFVDSYHGLKSKAGDTMVANCASCHGGHRILPSSDARSSIHPDNLRRTCGACHPGITQALASAKIHETGVGRKGGWAGFFATLYTVLIVTVIGFMIFHTAIDFAKQSRGTRKVQQVPRMSVNALAQHTLLAVSFLTLVLTGFALRFNEAWVFQTLFGWDGGSHVRGFVHRFAAAVFIVSVIWHGIYLATPEGRRFIRDMWPRRLDWEQLRGMISYNLGRRGRPPRFGRFSYVEKMEYWALLWGSIIMLVTGLFLWFDNAAVRYVPKGFLDVMLVIHFYEAILATLAVGIWHFYATIFSPSVYPGNPSWLTGEMPKRMYQHEHPADAAAD